MKTIKNVFDWFCLVIAITIGLASAAAILIQVDPMHVVHVRGST
jgi:hypothetical protein